MGSGVPMASASHMVWAMSSTITAALTASSGEGPMVNTPWFLSSTAREAPMASTTTCPISSPPISAKPPHRIGQPNSSAWAVRQTGMGRLTAAKAVA